MGEENNNKFGQQQIPCGYSDNEIEVVVIHSALFFHLLPFHYLSSPTVGKEMASTTMYAAIPAVAVAAAGMFSFARNLKAKVD
ncbi:hypothetical protein V6N13_026382 [Hibiscus sabdariffa]|uniref:Uncharacterized protein n=1 Tax=Hibiscus sabdariffa TaxID=183260 RepID=A0ABR2P6X9_9ROSI